MRRSVIHSRVWALVCVCVGFGYGHRSGTGAGDCHNQRMVSPCV